MCIRDRFNSPLKYSPHLFLTLSSPPIHSPSPPLILSPNPSFFFLFLFTSFQNILLPDSKFSVTFLHHSSFALLLSLIHISEPTILLSTSYAVFCLKKKINPKRNLA